MSKQESIDPADRDVPDRFPAPFVPDIVGDGVQVSRGSIDPKRGSGVVTAVMLVAALAAVALLAAGPDPSPPPLPSLSPSLPSSPPMAATVTEAFDPSRFILNALLVPALDGDAVPLRWVDPRPPSRCGPATEVRVNHEPLVVGALVPVAPFEIEWRADGCRPFGVHGPRFDGPVRLMIFREEWGLSAIVEPHGLRVAFAGHETTLTQSSGAWLPFIADATEPVELISIGEGD